MAEKEKSPPRRRPTQSARQQMLETLATSTKEVEDRGDALAKPEEKLQAKAVNQAVAAAEGLATEGVVKSIGELKSAVGRTLTQLSDRLEEEVSKYVQIQRAIVAKEAELKEIYEIQKSASTLTGLIEAQQQRRDQFEAEFAEEKERLDAEMETTRAQWESESKAREAEIKERESVEQKRRQREQEEYRYAFAREQQLAKDRFADESAKAEAALAGKVADAERQMLAREKALADREQDLKDLRARADASPRELETAVAKAVQDASARILAEATAREELLKREFTGERNVLTTRITSLEQTIKEQAAQLLKFSQQAEKAYAQVQDIAIKAIDGSSNFKSLTNLQQLLTEQARKTGQEK